MIRKMLVPLDGSPLAERALPYAEQLAAVLGAELILLGVAPSPPGRAGGAFRPANHVVPGMHLPESAEDLDKQLHPVSKESQMASLEAQVKARLVPAAEALQEKGLRARVAVAFGRPAEAILRYAQDAPVELIVLCTHGEGGLSCYAYGGTADRVARRSTIPVLLVRPEEVAQLLPLPKIERLQL